MTTAEKLVQIAQNEQAIADINNELETIINGGNTGGKSYYDTFWDSCQRNGNRTNYNYAFMGTTWNNTTYNPKYSFESANSVIQMFQASNVEEIGELYMPLVTKLQNTFAYNTSVITIGKITVSDDCTYSSTFASCSKLQNVEFGSVISNNISLENSTVLSKKSIENIIGQLSKITSGFTATFSETAKSNAFTDEEWATLIATRPNWTISLA